jgi:hypothetical protein
MSSYQRVFFRAKLAAGLAVGFFMLLAVGAYLSTIVAALAVLKSL